MAHTVNMRQESITPHQECAKQTGICWSLERHSITHKYGAIRTRLKLTLGSKNSSEKNQQYKPIQVRGKMYSNNKAEERSLQLRWLLKTCQVRLDFGELWKDLYFYSCNSMVCDSKVWGTLYLRYTEPAHRTLTYNYCTALSLFD